MRTCSTAVRPRSRSGRSWRPPAPRPGACTPATSSSSTWRSSRAARSTSTRRSTRSGSATGPPPRRGPHARAVPHPAQPDPPRAPRAPAAAQRARPPERRRPHRWSSRRARLGTGEPDDMVIVVLNLDPHGTRETTVHLDMPALGLDWHDTFVVARRAHRREVHLGRAQLRPAGPLPRARAHPGGRGGAPLSRASALDQRPEPTGHLPRRPVRSSDARLVQDRGLLRGAGAVVPRRQRRRHRRLQGPDREARLPAVARRRLPVGAAVLHLAAARRRATTSPTTPTSSPRSAPSRTSTSSSTRPTSAASG